MKRRTFIAGLGATSLSALVSKVAMGVSYSTDQKTSARFLRPPGALAADDFESRCIRCGQCGESCPNHCIRYFGLENGLASLDTPYIIPREQACILCMKCGDVCPTDALKKVVRELEPILQNVHMGKAVVDENLCLSYQGKTCGVCYRACPLPDVAIYVGRLEQPHVTDKCVGCGLCERSCIQMPQAIRIMPEYG